MTKHKYSTWTLIIIIIVVVGTYALADLDTSDLDSVCSTDNSLLKRISGSWQCSTTHYAEGWYHNYSTPLTVSISSIGIYYNITNFNMGEYRGFTWSGDGVIVNKSGTYLLNAGMSFYGGNSGTYEVELFINDKEAPHCSFFRSTSTSAIGNAHMSCLDNLNEGDLLVMKVKDSTNPAQNINIQRLNFNIIEVQ